MLALTIREKNGEERQLIFEKEEVTIGRATGSDIVLPRNNISKRHARLVDKHDKVVIVDLRSTNGTYVNGRRITAPELLTYEDKVYIGDFVIRLSRPAEQHPSQKMTAPYSASPTPAEPRTARAATAAVDPHLPPPLDDSDFMSEEPLPARAAFPPAPPAPPAPNDDESTRAIAAMPDDDDFPPPPKPKIEAPKPTPPKPKAPAPVVAAPVAPPTPPLHVAPTPPTPPTPAAPVTPAAPKAAPRAARPPSEDPPTMVPTSRDPGLTPVVKKAVQPQAPPTPPPAPMEDDEAATGELDAAQGWTEEGGGFDPWAEWNAAIEAVVTRIEAENPELSALGDVVGVATTGVDEAIESGAIAADTDRAALVEDVVLELTAGGPLAELLADPSVTLIAMNGPKSIHVARAPAPAPLEVNGRLFASTRSYRRALAQLSGRDEEVIADLVGLDEHRLADGAVLRFIGSGNSTPHAVWLRGATDMPLLPDLVADGLLDQAQAQVLTQAIAAGLSIAVVGSASAARAALSSAIAAEAGLDRRVAVVGDGTRLALPQADVARVAASALMSGGHLVALEAELIVFERVDLQVGSDWVEASLSGGAQVLSLIEGASAEKALRRLSLLVEMATGLEGRGAALVGECLDLVVTLARTADGGARVDKVLDVESQKDGYTLKAPARR